MKCARMSGLYIHIPFCGSRCPYCDFSFVVRKDHLAERYVNALLKEFRTRTAGNRPQYDTIFFGGGTPSEIDPLFLNGILAEVQSVADLSSRIEITAEANPEDRDHFYPIRESGVNRLSLGVQALDNESLKALGRRHSKESALAAYDSARRAGFDNINIDLIFGAPDQSLLDWENTLDRAIELDPEHFSVYGLTIERDTAFDRRRKKGQLPLPAEGVQADMYEAAVERLGESDYIQYEISNFSKPGKACRHNIACWERQPYLGIGLSAHSFLNGCRTWNHRDLMAYIEKVESTCLAIEEEEIISDESEQLEQIMLGLRRPDGIPEELTRHATKLDDLLESRLIERTNGRIRLTPPGLLLADLVCAELVKEL